MTQCVILRFVTRPRPSASSSATTNRKLYDAGRRRYVTLQELARAGGARRGRPGGGPEDRRGPHRPLVLAQVVLEGVKERTAAHPRARCWRASSGWARPRPAAWAEWARRRSAARRARAEAERIVAGLLARGTADPRRGAGAAAGDRRARCSGWSARRSTALESRVRGLLERPSARPRAAVAARAGGALLAFERALARRSAPAAETRAAPAAQEHGRRRGESDGAKKKTAARPRPPGHAAARRPRGRRCARPGRRRCRP